MKCNNCGAEIGNSKVCEFCGAQISYNMRREQEQLNKQGCPQCGSSNIQFKRENQGEIRGKKSKQVVHRTVGFCKDCGYTWYPSGANSAPQKNNLVWWILGWIFFFPAPVMVLIWRKKNTWDIKVKIAVTVVFWVLIFALGSCSNSSDSSSKDTSTTKVEETANNENSEQASADDKSNDIVVEQATNEESTEVSGYDAIDKCYEELIANNTATSWNELSNQIRDLANKYNLYQDSKNTGLGVRYAKIATTREESKVISNGDLDKGTYYIRIVADFSKGSPDIQLIDNLNKSAESSEVTEEPEKTPEELYFEQLKHDTEWQMMPRDECKNITLEDRTLRLEISMSNTNKLLERYSDISDAILAVESGYDWWDTLVIDFGSQGVVTKTKDDLVDGHFEITKDDFIKE